MSINNSIYYRQISAQNDMSSVMNFSGADIWQEIIDNQSFIESQYDVIAGKASSEQRRNNHPSR